MSKKINLVGAKFSRLLVVSDAPKEPSGRYMVQCVCDCGNTKTVWSANLKNGSTRSCGCLRVEQLIPRNIARQRTHGMANKDGTTYRIWSGMLTRCRNTRSKDWPRYGGRGIAVCERWLDFAAFDVDMGPRPSGAHSIERRDNAGNYQPGNCRWATAKEQGANRRTTILLEHLGVVHPLGVWADIAKIKRATFYSRYRAGKRGDDLFHPGNPK